MFFLLEEPIKWLPEFLGTFTEFMVSMRRIQHFLRSNEINPKLVEYGNLELKKNKIDILIKNAHFTWAGDKQSEILNKNNEEG